MIKILRLKEILISKNITGKSLADMIGSTEASISNLVKGDSVPRKKTLLDISKALDIDIRELFVPTKDVGKMLINGFVQLESEIYKIESKEDLEIVLEKLTNLS